MTSDGIEPPLSDLESEVLPLHHEAMTECIWDALMVTRSWHADASRRPCSLMDKALAS